VWVQRQFLNVLCFLIENLASASATNDLCKYEYIRGAESFLRS